MFSLPPMPKVRKFQLKELRERHKEILRQKHMGRSDVDIAKALDVTPMTVGNTVRGELGKERLGDLEQSADIEAIDVALEIQKASTKAIEVMDNVLNGRERDASIALRVGVARDILDRAGHGKVTRIEGRMTHGYFGKVGIEMIKERARAIGITTGNVVEVVE